MAYPRSLSILFSLYVLTLVSTMSGMEIFSSCLILFILGLFLFRRELFYEIPLPPGLVPLLAFVGIAAVSILINPSPKTGYFLGKLRFFLLYPVMYYALSFLPSGWPWKRQLAYLLVAIAVYSTFQHFFSFDLIRPEGKKVLLFAYPEAKIGPLVYGLFNHHLTFSNIFLFYACLYSTLGALSKDPKQRPYLFLGAWLFLLVFWTQSRNAWGAVAVCVLLIAFVRQWKVGLTVFLLLGGLFLGSYNLDAGFRTRFQKTFLEKNDAYNLGPRSRLWMANWVMFQEHPWFGIGYNLNEGRAKEYVDRLYPEVEPKFYGHAHSMPLQILSGTGILGTLCFVSFWICLFMAWLSRVRNTVPRSEDSNVLIAAGIAFLGFWIQGVTQWNLGDAEVAHTVFLFLALIAATPKPKLSKATKTAN